MLRPLLPACTEHLFKRLLRDTPAQLIKFKIFKRSKFKPGARKSDKRLTRIKNLHTVPIGVWAAWVIEHYVFQWIIIIFILLNAIILGMQAELEPADDPTLNDVLRMIDLTILLVFILEILLKWLDSFQQFWDDPWNWFDLLVTMASAIPEIILFVTSENPEQSAQLAGIARNLRILRTFRTLKAIVRFGSLRIIVYTILDAFQSMSFIMITLLMVTYIFAIFGVKMFEQYTYSTRTDLQFQEKFSNVGQAFITLFQLLTLDQWFRIQDDIAKIVGSILTGIYFILWVWLGAFIFRNIFVGVMVRNFQMLSERLAKDDMDQQKKRKFDKMNEQLHKNLTLQTAAMNQRNPQDAQLWAQPSARINRFTDDAGRATPRHVLSDDDLGIDDTAVHLRSLQALLLDNTASAAAWDETVGKTLQAIGARKHETMWPRDTLFKYLQTMETLQENLKEYQELQVMAARALTSITDT